VNERWNRNIHYHPLILRALAAVGGRVLEVGCGEGQLVRSLAEVETRQVVGIDPHEASIERARQLGGEVDYLVGDFLTYAFEPASWDAVVSVAALHHMDFAVSLARASALLRRGGVFVAVGLARSTLADLPVDGLGFVAGPFLRAGRRQWTHPSPIVWPPPMTYREVREQATELLPGVAYRRHLLFRYSLTWTKQ
jgi:SAM-dependent methyltransferase